MSVIDLSNPHKKHHSWAGDSYRPFPTDDRLTETVVVYPKHGFTHVDAPSHMIRGGWSVDDCSLGQLCGEAALIDVSDCVPGKPATAELLETRGGHVRKGDILILRSNLFDRFPNTDRSYWTQSPYVDESGSRWIVERGCAALVVDFPQDYLAREMTGREIKNHEWTEHQIVLGARLMHVEHVRNLDQIRQQRVFFAGWPVRLPGADGGPARPVVLSEWPKGAARVIDLSLPLDSGWRNVVRVGRLLAFEKGDPVQETGFVALGHSHTHVVMPSYVDFSAASLDTLKGPGMGRVVGAADLVDLSDYAAGAPITGKLLAERAKNTDPQRILVLRTDHTARMPYSAQDFVARSPSLAEDAANWILDRGFKTVAVDFEIDAGRARAGCDLVRARDIPIEARLLKKGLVLIKNLCGLSQIAGTQFHLIAMPLHLPGAESAPARVLGVQWS